MKTLAKLACVLIAVSACGGGAGDTVQQKIPDYDYSRMQTETVNRGLLAIHNGNGRVSVSWRFLYGEPVDTGFDLYRRSGGGGDVKLNSAPLTKATFYVDEGVDTTVDNVYTVKVCGQQTGESYTLTPKLAEKPYLSFKLQPVEGFAEGAYNPNDASVADLDGDGEYEIIIKMVTSEYDNGHSGLCKEGTLIDAYKFDGTFLWRIDLGLNIRQGAHYTQMMLYDFDGDGKAELAVKTAEGTRFGDGSVIGDVNGDGITDYRITDPKDRAYGKILEGPEFLSIIEGATGRELARTDFIPRGEGKGATFGDSHGNRCDRYLGGAGYFDGVRPSILICRGYYAKTVVEAWNWRDGKLTRLWSFDTTADNGKYKDYEGQGNHNLRIGDIDGDGKDEVVYGACVIDHDGTGLYSTGLGHGDAMYLTDIDIDRPGLEVWQSHEGAPLRANSELRDARTGQTIWGVPGVEDVGRAAAEDIDPRFRGLELWTSGTDGVYTADGRFISSYVPGTNFAIWWDGDLNREILDGYYYGDSEFTPSGGPSPAWVAEKLRKYREKPSSELPAELRRVMRITKWTGDGVVPIDIPDQSTAAANNGTKSNPCISADIFGDWREELVVCSTDNTEIRVYMTDIPTDYRFYPLMSDNVYRMGVLCENICYNQPPMTGIYFGSDLGKFWDVRYERQPGFFNNGKSRLAADGKKNGMHERLKNTVENVQKDITVWGGETEYRLDARLDYDTVEWTLNGSKAGSGRYLTVKASDWKKDEPVKVGIRATYFGCVFEDEGSITFTDKERPSFPF